MAAEIRLFPCLTDNFGYLIHDPASKAVASIDAPEAGPIIKALEREGWTLTRYSGHPSSRRSCRRHCRVEAEI